MKIWMIITMLLLLVLTACTTGNTVKDETYKIGVIIPVSGHFAYYGEKALESLELKKEDYPDIEFIIEDNEGDTGKSVSAALKLINIDQVDLIMTAMSSVSASVADIAELNKVPLFYTSVLSSPAKENSFVFKNYIDIEKDCKELAKMVKGKKGSVLGQNAESTLICIKAFEDTGFNLNIELFDRENKDFKTHLMKIKAQNPDFILLRISTTNLPLLIKQMEAFNMKDFQLICPHITGGCNPINELGKVFSSGIGSDFYIEKNPKVKAVDFLLKTRFNSIGNDWSYNFYESIDLIVPIIKDCKGNNLYIRDTLLSSEFEGLDGTLKFNKNGIVNRNSTIFTFNGKNWVTS